MAEKEKETSITVEQLHEKKKDEDPLLLDVREPREAEICQLDNSRLIPLGDLRNQLEEIPEEREIIVYCRTGDRSEMACEFLRKNGFNNVKNLEGGIREWANRIDDDMATY